MRRACSGSMFFPNYNIFLKPSNWEINITSYRTRMMWIQGPGWILPKIRIHPCQGQTFWKPAPPVDIEWTGTFLRKWEHFDTLSWVECPSVATILVHSYDINIGWHFYQGFVLWRQIWNREEGNLDLVNVGCRLPSRLPKPRPQRFGIGRVPILTCK